MVLSAEFFEQLRNSLGQHPVDGGQKRRSPRIGMRGSATLFAAGRNGQSRPQAATVRDLSATGISVLVRSPFVEGRQFALRLQRVGDDPMVIICTVKYCKCLEEGLFQVGAEFSKVFDRVEPAAPKPPAVTKAAAPKPSSEALEIERLRQAIIGD